MKVFFLTSKYNTKDITLKPRVPASVMTVEDKITARICVSMSVNGCLSSIDGLCNYDKLFVYEAEVEEFVQPTPKQVPDAFLTGELWLTKQTDFKLVGSAIIKGYCGLAIGDMENNQYVFEYNDICKEE